MSNCVQVAGTVHMFIHQQQQQRLIIHLNSKTVKDERLYECGRFKRNEQIFLKKNFYKYTGTRQRTGTTIQTKHKQTIQTKGYKQQINHTCMYIHT